MGATWEGVTRLNMLNSWAADAAVKLADSAKRYDWPVVLDILSKQPRFVNTTRPDGKALYTPLHQAAHGGAPIEVVKRLLELGAWRTLRNANGERPVDIARRRSHAHLVSLLEPVYKKPVLLEDLRKIQENFHAVIRGRVEELVTKYALRLPELEPLLEMNENEKVWFAVPGMYGGFAYWLEGAGTNARLITESWCRVVGGSGQRHEIAASGSRLLEEGFV